jgi:hypothetical protein
MRAGVLDHFCLLPFRVCLGGVLPVAGRLRSTIATATGSVITRQNPLVTRSNLQSTHRMRDGARLARPHVACIESDGMHAHLAKSASSTP